MSRFLDSASSLFDSLPVACWEEDWTHVRPFVNSLAPDPSGLKIILAENSDALNKARHLIDIGRINSAALALLQVDERKDALEIISREFSTTEALEVFADELVAFMRGEERFAAELPFRTATGREIIIHLQMRFTRVDDPSDILLVSLSDVTANRKAATDVAVKSATLEAAQRMSQLGTWSYEIGSNRIIWSDSAYELLGLNGSEFDGTLERFLALLHPDDRPRVADDFVGGTPGEKEYRIIQKDGTLRWMYERAGVEHDAAGQPVRRMGLVMDITDRKPLVRAIEENEFRHATGAQLVQMIATDQPLDDILNLMIRSLETMNPGLKASVLMIDADGRFQIEAAPSLPAEYNEYVRGRKVDPNVGTCGAAASSNEVIISEDMRDDPLWKDHLWMTDKHGIRSCMSAPLHASTGEVIGTLAFYRSRPWKPSEEERRTLTSARNLAGIAIERERKSRALKLSEERFRKTFEEAAIGIAIVSLDGRFLSVNRAYSRMVGYSEEALVARTLFDITHPDDHDRQRSVYDELLRGERESFVMEQRYIREDGGIVWARVSLSAQHDENGNKVAVIGAAEDITWQREVEVQLAKEQSLRRMAAQISRVGGWEIDVQAGTLHWSDELHDILEYPRDFQPEIQDALSLYAEEDLPQVQAALDACIQHGTPADVTVRVRTGNGELIWARVNAEATRGPDNSITHIRGAFQDVTKQREAEEELRRAQSLIRMAAKLSSLGAWEIDIESGSVLWSDELREILEFPPDFQAELEPTIQLYHPDDLPEVRAALERCTKESNPQDLEARIQTRTGRWLTIRLFMEPIVNENEEVVGIRGAFQDISRQKETQKLLLQEQRRFRELADAMPLIVWTNEPDGTLDFVNQAYRDYAGITDDEDPVLAASRAIHPDDRERSDEFFRTALNNQTEFVSEIRLIHHESGEERWFLARAIPVKDADGNILKWYGTTTDIHDVKRLEEDAQRLASRLTNTLESITDAFFTLDDDWCFAYLNKEAERLLQRDRRDLLGKNVWEEFPEAAGTIFQKEYERAVRDRVTTSFETYFAPLGVWLDVRGFPTAEGLAVYFNDISSHRDARRRIAEQAALLDKAQDAILVRDLKHEIVFWNKGAERIYGWSGEEALGKSAADLLYSNTESFFDATNVTITNGEWSGELTHVAKDGRELNILGRWTLVRDENGAAKSILVINTDITERKRLEEQLMRTQRLESIGTLAGGIAHDLNNVFAPILLNIELLSLDEHDAEKQSVLRSVEANARRGADMVQQVLAFARGAEGRRAQINVRHIVRDVQDIMRDTFPKNIDVRVKSDADLWPLVADPTQIHQTLMNICVNARDAMAEGGTISISLENAVVDEVYARMNLESEPGPYVVISIEDTGMGMTPATRERLFEPFFTTKEIGEGTGLGLPTCHSIVQRHGGFINVYSEIGKGTTFKIYLPAESTDVATEHVAIARTQLPSGDGQTVLVVDDEESVREVVRKTLERFGYRVILAEHGAAAVALYARHQDEIDVVLTDMAMPVMDGPATVIALQAINPTVRIVGSSGLGASGNVAKAAGAGLEHFVPKPYTVEVLLRTLHAALTDE